MEGKSYFPQRPVINKNRANRTHVHGFQSPQGLYADFFFNYFPLVPSSAFSTIICGRTYGSILLFSGKRNRKKTRGCRLFRLRLFVHRTTHGKGEGLIFPQEKKVFFGRSQFGKAK